MEDATSITAEEVARLLWDTTGLRYTLLGRLPGGESGAYNFRAPDGSRVVVKWDSGPRSSQLRAEAVVLSERLRRDPPSDSAAKVRVLTRRGKRSSTVITSP